MICYSVEAVGGSLMCSFITMRPGAPLACSDQEITTWCGTLLALMSTHAARAGKAHQKKPQNVHSSQWVKSPRSRLSKNREMTV